MKSNCQKKSFAFHQKTSIPRIVWWGGFEGCGMGSCVCWGFERMDSIAQIEYRSYSAH